MKRLSNISPFILLLVPVFIMMIFAFTTSASGSNQSNEVALKNTTSATFAKVSNDLPK